MKWVAGKPRRYRPFENRTIVVALHEADVLRVGLCVHRQAQPLGVGARFCFRQVAERQQKLPELVRPQPGERVGLVLRRVAHEQAREAGFMLEPRVVTGRNIARAEAAREPQQRAELHEVVA